MRALLGLAILCLSARAATTTRSCVGSSAPAASFQLRVQPAGGGEPLPVRWANNIGAGAKLAFQALRLPPEVRKDAKVSLLLAGMDGGDVTLMEPVPAATGGEWTVPSRCGLVVLVLAPQGLDERRITNLVNRDAELVTQLADYAEQTAELEATIEALTALDEEEYQWARLDRASPGEQALFALVRALNPSAAGFNPLGTGRLQGPASMVGRASNAFFENAGGMVPGGGAFPAVKSWLFPDTEFRTAYAQPEGADAMTLCVARQLTRTRNKLVYLWARRVVNAGPPAIGVTGPQTLAMGVRSTLGVRLKNAADWDLVGGVRAWTLAGAAGSYPVAVRPRPRRALELDLSNFPGAAGAYRLTGKWDWETVTIPAELAVTPLGDFAAARLEAASQARLAAGAGPVTVRVGGTDFQFVESVSIRRAGSGRDLAELSFVLPKGWRAGRQDYIELDIDTARLAPGDYRLAFAQTGGAQAEVPVRLLPAAPRLRPMRANLGETAQRLPLAGEGLERLESVSSDGAKVELLAGGREVAVTLGPGVKAGERLALKLKFAGAAEAAVVADAIEVAGPRPRIVSAKISLPDDLGVSLRQGELPAGFFVGAAIEVQNPGGSPALELECGGERRRVAAQKLSETSLFASFDPSAGGRANCELSAAVAAEAGASSAATLGRVVRLPRIDSFTLSGERAGDNIYGGALKGRELETIERTGWDAKAGLAVPGLPATQAGEGERQTLRIVMPWPSPAPRAPLFIWLRGEQEGRATKALY